MTKLQKLEILKSFSIRNNDNESIRKILIGDKINRNQRSLWSANTNNKTLA